MMSEGRVEMMVTVKEGSKFLISLAEMAPMARWHTFFDYLREKEF